MGVSDTKPGGDHPEFNMPASALLSDARSLVADGADARSALVLAPAPDSLAPFEVHVPQGAIDDWHLRLGYEHSVA
jgi:hypothetical protein